MVQNHEITMLFTVVSLIRGYGVRRLFNHFRKELDNIAINLENKINGITRRWLPGQQSQDSKRS